MDVFEGQMGVVEYTPVDDCAINGLGQEFSSTGIAVGGPALAAGQFPGVGDGPAQFHVPGARLTLLATTAFEAFMNQQ